MGGLRLGLLGFSVELQIFHFGDGINRGRDRGGLVLLQGCGLGLLGLFLGLRGGDLCLRGLLLGLGRELSLLGREFLLYRLLLLLLLLDFLHLARVLPNLPGDQEQKKREKRRQLERRMRHCTLQVVGEFVGVVAAAGDAAVAFLCGEGGVAVGVFVVVGRIAGIVVGVFVGVGIAGVAVGGGFVVAAAGFAAADVVVVAAAAAVVVVGVAAAPGTAAAPVGLGLLEGTFVVASEDNLVEEPRVVEVHLCRFLFRVVDWN